MTDIVATLPGRLVEIAETNPLGLVAAVLMTAATVMYGISIFRRNGS
jgi:hypothetical protein